MRRLAHRVALLEVCACARRGVRRRRARAARIFRRAPRPAQLSTRCRLSKATSESSRGAASTSLLERRFTIRSARRSPCSASPRRRLAHGRSGLVPPLPRGGGARSGAEPVNSRTTSCRRGDNDVGRGDRGAERGVAQRAGPALTVQRAARAGDAVQPASPSHREGALEVIPRRPVRAPAIARALDARARRRWPTGRRHPARVEVAFTLHAAPRG